MVIFYTLHHLNKHLQYELNHLKLNLKPNFFKKDFKIFAAIYKYKSTFSTSLLLPTNFY